MRFGSPAWLAKYRERHSAPNAEWARVVDRADEIAGMGGLARAIHRELVGAGAPEAPPSPQWYLPPGGPGLLYGNREEDER